MKVDRARVGEVLRIQRREVRIDPLSDYTLIGVYSWGKGIFHRDPARGAELGDYRYFAVEPGGLVLSNIQAWEGAIAHAGAKDTGTIGTHRFLSYVPIGDSIDTNWARWFFLSEPGMELIRQAAPGTTMRNRTLAIERFEALEIPLPPVELQRRVAARLDRITEATTDLGSRTARATVLRDALAVSLSARPDLSDNEKASRGWQLTTLRDVLAPALDPVKVDRSVAYHNVGIYSFGRGLFRKPPIEGATTSANTLYRIRAGQFIYSRLFAFEGAYAFVDPQFDNSFVSNEFPTFDTDPTRLNAAWLASVLRSPRRWSELAGSSKGLGGRRQRIPVEAVLEYQLWLPPIDEQDSMVAAVGRISQAAVLRRSADQRVSALVPAALNQAFAHLS